MIKPSQLPRRLLCLFLALLLLPPLPARASGTETENTLIGGEDSGLINILLIGRDGEDDAVSRSDSIILCSFRPETRQITITSFLRDLYVPIPGMEDNRINAAYACGGVSLLRQTMEDNFDLCLDGCIEVDFSQFSQIIDVLGGVTIELRQDEAETINAQIPGSLTEGTNTLTGEQALAYSRIRKLDKDGDFSRTGRQRKLLTSLLDSYRSADLLTVLSVIMDTLPMITTDLTKKDIFRLAAKLFPFLENPVVVSQRIPADGSYSYRRVRDMEVLIADAEDVKQQLRKSLLAQDENVS